MKPLSDKQVQACENAVGKVCRCRCGGAFHGRKGGGTNNDGSLDRAYFESLPADDPHHMQTDQEQAAAKKARKEAKQREKRIISLKRSIALSGAYGLNTAYYENELAKLGYTAA